MANRDIAAASAWLTANPKPTAIPEAQMSDDVFMAFYLRNLSPVMRSRKWCYCGEIMDSLSWHAQACKDKGSLHH
jgi:hypothetical protein